MTTDGHASPVEVTRLFTEALHARDLDSLRPLVSEDAEFPAPTGKALHGHEGLERVVKVAADRDLILAREGIEDVGDGGVAARVTVRVRELVSKTERRAVALFEVRDGRVAEFEVIVDT